MKERRTIFNLKIQKIEVNEEVCYSFDLLSAEGQKIFPKSIILQLSETLDDLKSTSYPNWRSYYHKRYDPSRGQAGVNEEERDHELKASENNLLERFQEWLQGVGAIQVEIQKASNPTVLIDCDDLDLVRLPWEFWLGAKSSAQGTLRIGRTVLQGSATSSSEKQQPVPKRQVLRHYSVLVIWGWAEDLEDSYGKQEIALQILETKKRAKLTHFRCKEIWETDLPQDDPPSQRRETLIRQLKAKLTEHRWDLLFYVGHSDEIKATNEEKDGKLWLYKEDATINLSQIQDALATAQQNGLQVAVFNSCRGIKIAQKLIQLGIGQVVVMKDKVYKDHAAEFLTAFCKNLSQCKDVLDSLIAACQSLQDATLNNQAYRSAYLLPSLYSHPDAELFRFEPSCWKRLQSALWPTRQLAIQEATTVSLILLLSLVSPVRGVLFDVRMWTQTVYQDLAGWSLPPQPDLGNQRPLLVGIDQDFVQFLESVQPIDPGAIANLIDTARQLQAKTVGVYYILDRKSKNDSKLQATIDQIIQKKVPILLFGTKDEGGGKKSQIPSNIANPNGVLLGDTLLSQYWYIDPPRTSRCGLDCPFAYMLALSEKVQQSGLANIPTPQQQRSDQNNAIANSETFQTRYLKFAEDNNLVIPDRNPPMLLGILPKMVRPIIDFAIPPKVAYEFISAGEFLQRSRNDPAFQALIKGRPVLITSWGYTEAQNQEDTVSTPLAIDYWRSQSPRLRENREIFAPSEVNLEVMPMGAAQGYMVYQLLTNHIPWRVHDFWMVMLAIPLGKGIITLSIQTMTQEQYQTRKKWYALAIAGYWLSGLVGYGWLKLLLPWVLPSVMFSWYVFFLPNQHHERA